MFGHWLAAASDEESSSSSSSSVCALSIFLIGWVRSDCSSLACGVGDELTPSLFWQ
jgi:hypothetical protein